MCQSVSLSHSCRCCCCCCYGASCGQNLLENTKDKELLKTNVTLMVQWQIDRQVTTLKSRSNDDPEFIADLEYLEHVLEAKLEDIRCHNRADSSSTSSMAHSLAHTKARTEGTK